MTPVEGQTLGGFVLTHRISEGAMGSVWAAEHSILHRDVAVKFLTTALRDAVSRERFALEGQTVARMSCPHVPQIFDHGTSEDGTPYLVMEAVGGATLRDWVKEHGCLTTAQLSRLVDHVCLAMTAAHELGIVHRDIKPENIVLRGGAHDFHATLVDFGISKSTVPSPSTPRLTLDGLTLGTPSYMSPEHLVSANNVDDRTDIWALGVVAYWALTGALPFRGESPGAIYAAIQQRHFTLVSELRPDLPVALDDWFARVLSRDVESRIQSAALMSGMLKVALARPEEWTQRMPVVRPRVPPPLPVDDDVHVGTPTSVRAPPSRERGLGVALAVLGGAVAALTVVGVGRTLPPMRDVDDDSMLPPVVESAARLSLASKGFEEAPSRPLTARVALTPPTPHPTPAARAKPWPKAAVGANSRNSVAPKDAGAIRPDPFDWHPRDEVGEP
jgi:serine/threonine-protein kinase